jgi:hypothetical protein
VPDNLKTEYQALRDRMNSMLQSLKPLEQVPAANDAACALNSFAYTITQLFDYVDAFRSKIESMANTLAGKTTALQGLNEKIEKGELLEKGTVQAATDTAVQAALKPYQAEIQTMRKAQIALCKLPDAPDAVLGQAADAFASSLAQAQKNLEILAKRGFALGGRGDSFIKRTAWLEATAFQGEAKLVEDLAAELKINTGAPVDPFVGGTKADPAPAAEKKTPAAARKLSLA